MLGALILASPCFALTPQERVDILWQRAQDQLEVGKLDDALASANKAVRIAPNYYRACWLLGWVRAARGEHADAEPAYRAAIKLNPDSRELHYHLGNALAAQGNLSDAITQYLQAHAVEPLLTALGNDDADICASAGCCLSQICDARAVEPLITTLRDDPAVVAIVRYVAASALAAIGTPAEPALPHLRGLAEHDPDEDVPDTVRQAIQRIEQALASEPSPPSAGQQ